MEGLPLTIEYAVSVLEEIRAAAVAGFYRFPRGGLEVGGLLFGAVEARTVRVLAARPVACEYLHGPSYTLSEKDEVLLRRMLHAPAVDPALQGMQPVGWYHSHTRSEIQLSEQDLRIYNRYLPRYWQVALVVRPQSYDTTRAGFFMREPDGSLRTESSYNEFVIPESPAAGHAAPSEPPEPAVQASAPSVADRPAVPPPPSTPAYLRHAEAPPAARRSSGWKWALALLVLVLLAGVAKFAPHNWLARRPPHLALRAVDLDGALEISWDPTTAPIRTARTAWLQIQDGAEQSNLPLDRNALLQGRFTWVRHSPSVEVRLRVFPREGDPAEESVHVLGTAAPSPAPTAQEPAAVAPPAAGDTPVSSVPDLPAEATTPKPVQAERKPVESEQRPLQPERTLVPSRTFNLPRLERSAGRSTPVSSLPQPPAVSQPAATLANGAPRVLDSRSAVPPPPAQPLPAKPAYSGPRSGRIIWTGQLARGGVLAIEGQTASLGYLTGALPGVPVRVSTHPAQLSPHGLVVYIFNPASARRERAGPQNGWNDTAFQWDPQRASGLRVEETPDTANHWKRLVLRASSTPLSVIVIDWQVLD